MVVTKSSKIAASRSGGMPEPVSVTLISAWSPIARGDDGHLAALGGRLNRVRDQVAVHAAEREPIAVDDERLRGVVRLDRDAVALAFGAHRVDDLGDRRVRRPSENRSIGFGLTTLRRSSMKRLSVSSSRSMVVPERLARLRVDIVAGQQARAVADVLDRMREIVDEAGGDAAEHRLPLLALDVLLQLDEAVGHRVEGVAELAELVAGADVDARVELAGGDALRAALQREDRRDERPPEEIADGDHDEQRDRDRRHELALELRSRWRRPRSSAARR